MSFESSRMYGVGGAESNDKAGGSSKSIGNKRWYMNHGCDNKDSRQPKFIVKVCLMGCASIWRRSDE